MSTEVKPQTELIKVEEAGALIISGLRDALPYCQKLNELAIEAFKPVLDTIEAEGMNAELDKQLNDLIVRASSAISKMEAKRKPGTQMMTQIAKVFTGLENGIEAQKIIAQGHRNGWAKKCAAEAKEKEAAILKQQAVDKEKIEAKAKAESQLRETFQNKLLEFKSYYTTKLNGATLETFDKVSELIKGLTTTYPRDKFYEIVVNIGMVYLTKEDLAPIIFNTKVALYDELSVTFRENMEDHQRNLLDQLPSKKAELVAIQKAGAEKKKELEAAALKRQQDEELRLKQEAQANKEKDQQTVAMQANIAQSTNLFESAAQLSEVKADTGPVRQGYKITVGSPAGWGAIFMFWFEKEGQKMKADEMGKKTLDQMKSFCEKHAFKTSEKIDHVHVTYEDDYKAIAKAA